jgi:hypothetical protein
MPLSAQQRQQLANIIASSEMEGGQVSEREKNLEALMLGELRIEDAIADALRHAEVEHRKTKSNARIA